MRRALNQVTEAGAIVRVGTAQCNLCFARSQTGDPCWIGCISTGVDPTKSCAECGVKSTHGECDFGAGANKKEQQAMVLGALKSVEGKLSNMGEMMTDNPGGEYCCEEVELNLMVSVDELRGEKPSCQAYRGY